MNRRRNWIIAGVIGGGVLYLMLFLFFRVLIGVKFLEIAKAGPLSEILGCVVFGLLVTHIMQLTGKPMDFKNSLKEGVKLGLYFGLINIFLQQSDFFSSEIAMMGWDLLSWILTFVILSLVVGFVLERLRKIA